MRYANTSPPSTRARARARGGSENQHPDELPPIYAGSASSCDNKARRSSAQISFSELPPPKRDTGGAAIAPVIDKHPAAGLGELLAERFDPGEGAPAAGLEGHPWPALSAKDTSVIFGGSTLPGS
jgi:hypothetical protein